MQVVGCAIHYTDDGVLAGPCLIRNGCASLRHVYPLFLPSTRIPSLSIKAKMPQNKSLKKSIECVWLLTWLPNGSFGHRDPYDHL